MTDMTRGHSGYLYLAGSTIVESFKAKIEIFAPRAVGFRAAEVFFGRKSVEYGRHNQRIGETTLFVLPSTSGAARGYWNPEYWRELARFILARKLLPYIIRTC